MSDSRIAEEGDYALQPGVETPGYWLSPLWDFPGLASLLPDARSSQVRGPSPKGAKANSQGFQPLAAAAMALRFAIAFLFLACSSPIAAQDKGIHLDASRAGITIHIDSDKSTTTLVTDIRLTLTIEGPEPVEATIPPGLLDPQTSAPFWHVKAESPPTLTDLGKGRQRREYRYRLSPFEAGPRIPLVFLPWKVQVEGMQEMDVLWPEPATIHVMTSIPLDRIDREYLRPATDPETIPPATSEPSSSWWGWLIGTWLIAFVVAAFWFVRRYQRAKQAPIVHDGGWAIREIESAFASRDPRPALVVQIAEILRLHLGYRGHFDPAHLTTQELILHLSHDSPGVEGEILRSLQTLFEEADTAKFTPFEPSGDSVEELLRQSRELIESLRVRETAPVP